MKTVLVSGDVYNSCCLGEKMKSCYCYPGRNQKHLIFGEKNRSVIVWLLKKKTAVVWEAIKTAIISGGIKNNYVLFSQTQTFLFLFRPSLFLIPKKRGHLLFLVRQLIYFNCSDNDKHNDWFLFLTRQLFVSVAQYSCYFSSSDTSSF